MEITQGRPELARDGRVTCRNHLRLGYDRWTWGVYGPSDTSAPRDPDEDRRRRWWSLVRGVMVAYRDHDVVAYGPTALQVLGVALPTALEDWGACHVVVPTGAYRPARSGVVTHEMVMHPRPWRVVDGVPVLHPVDHWLQLRRATEDELIEVGDGFLRRRDPLLSLAALTARVDRLAGATGVKRVRRVLPLVMPGTDSLAETRTRLILVRAGLPCPAVNLPVLCRASGRTYHVDMGYEAERVAVEYDGAYHVEDRRQMEIDARRRRDLQDEGWLVITVTAEQWRYPSEIVASVEQALVLRRANRRAR